MELEVTPMMTVVYMLWHVYERDDRDEQKFIGAYSTEDEAIAAVERLRNKPGFRDYPRGFQIHEVTLNRDGWTEGFVDIKPSEM